jgi:hypothetical protein
MAHIVMPTTATRQGGAFEDLILSHYQRSGQYRVREWSTYLHGASGQWWQCDGIIEDGRNRYLIEAKFFRDRPATVRDIGPERRQKAALDTGCTAVRYISLGGFAPDMLNWNHSPDLDIEFLAWADLRDQVLDGLSGHASALLDEFTLTDTVATATQSSSGLHFAPVRVQPLSEQFPEFVTLPDSLELWLRRLPKLALQLSQLSHGEFWYDNLSGQVHLVSQRASDLSLQEAWEIEDAFSGYASRTYPAVRATAQALSIRDNGLIRDIRQQMSSMGWGTGPSGIRNSLDFLVQLGLAHKELDGRSMRYRLSTLGRAYAAGGPDDALFAQVLKRWLPYRAMCQAITERGVPAQVDDVITYFRTQYAPYTPYAKSLFNPNKTEGLLRLHRLFGL